ncbi:hypothetical protein [Mycobacterium sp. 141]|uniref:hypothetical protein n=1 Tax=Mycobacterium sp. 141 TaxID=1120797 RepID=UPI00036054D5|nr:hypothetical protein [Mycobacterium sp. 141]
MARRGVERWNIAAFALYILLIPVAFTEFMMGALGFGMATDGCHDAACDAGYHENAAILTVGVGLVVVLVATGALMLYGQTREKIVIVWPFVAAAAMAGVFVLGMAVLH